MKIVGLTGGIGSGKTTVARMFEALGVPLYIADERAKYLMDASEVIKKELIILFGEEAYLTGQLNKQFIAGLIFKDASLLKKMNAIVHPRVADDFEQWKLEQKSPYIIKEAAIIFEINAASKYDFIITVIADLEKKIERVMHRDQTTKEKVMAIVKNQWSDAEKIAKSDFVITNHDLQETRLQVEKIHNQLLQLAQSN